MSVVVVDFFVVDAFILLKELALLKLPTGTTDDNKSLNSRVKKKKIKGTSYVKTCYVQKLIEVTKTKA